jgi:uncharacterized repeat protein (TIGR01451 family)
MSGNQKGECAVKTNRPRPQTLSALRLPGLLLAVTLLAVLPLGAWGSPSDDPASPPETAQQHPSGSPAAQAEMPGKGWEEWESLPLQARAKVDPRILAELRGEALPAHLARAEQAPLPSKDAAYAKTRFLVYLKAQADLEAIQARPLATLAQQRTAVVDALVTTARATQGPVKTLLDAQVASGDTAAYFPYYIVNGLAVEGNLATVIALARREDVQHIAANYRLVQFEGSDPGDAYPLPSAFAPNGASGGLDPANWNIDLVDAERVWNELGIDGRGAVVADFDTGVTWNHPALVEQYRGWNGTNTEHNYNWFEFDSRDPTYWDPSGDYGPSASTAPSDCSDHGTHTMGTMVGDGGTSTTHIGMAPGAQWIAVPGICGRTMPDGYADDIGGIRTFQWLLCPTDLSGDLATRDCSKAPDVVNNSWGSSNPADDTFRPIVQALRAAGIAPVFASGNPSAGPGSIGSPASIPEAITVGATDIDDQVTSFSGRGPSFYEGIQKPELTAPGANVKSSIPYGGYANASGTSMAAPHVSGLVALMVSADLRDGRRDLDVDELLAFMQYSAVDLGPPGPDDEYGYGRIDAYRAVRWVLGAGNLRGTVRDANTLAPIDRATMTGVEVLSGDRFASSADASGTYSATVPGGAYDVRVEAFGYAGRIFAGVSVLTGTDTLVDFGLTPLPTRLLTGQVRGEAPVRGARVYADARPGLSYTTGTDGAYALRLPVGTHDITVEADGYRIGHAKVTITDAGASYNLDLTHAPSILLVEADGYRGWFSGRPARNFFRYALDARGFRYDTYIVTDPTSPPDLSPADEPPYDVVIWAHTYGSPGVSGPQTVAALTDYLDGGGRLILSGQDIGYWDSFGSPYYADYLHAGYRTSSASGLGGTVSGTRFLAGIDLTLNEAALYNYPNTALRLSPDGVAPRDGNAYPILVYDNGRGDAALAIAPCNQPFRAVYLAVGYENLGPRAYDRPPEYADLLERSIEWVAGTKPQYDVDLALTPAEQVGTPGAVVHYGLTLANTGRTLDTYDLSVADSHWRTHVYSGSAEAPPSITLPPCTQLDLTVQVGIPGTAQPGAADAFEIVASSRAAPGTGAHARATTISFPRWQIETPMPTPRYRLAAAYLPGDVSYYAIGGLGGDSWGEPTDANERYNACTGGWEPMAPMPTPRGNITAAVLDGKIYVPGGYAGAAAAPEEHLDVLEIYDPESNSWARGAPLPEPLSGIAVAAYDGKLYAFGGATPDGYLVDSTYQYDPVTDAWETRAPMPGGTRGFAAAAALNDKIYVVGGWYVNTVEVYDPATDSWAMAAPMHDARQSPGLTVAPDGRLYVSGGGTDTWDGLRSVERYDPAINAWQLLPSLNDGNRAGSASAFAGGRIYAAGGVDAQLSDANESLQLFDSFCRSTKRTWQDTAYPFESPIQAPVSLSLPPLPRHQTERDIYTGTRITYTITLYDDASTLGEARVVDPIPPGTTFAGFGENAAGATYDAVEDQVEWSGAIPRDSPPLSFTFGIDVDLAEWHSDDIIVNEATMDGGGKLVFTRTATTRLDFPDPALSTKAVDKTWAIAGDQLNYTVHIENPSIISDVITVVDPIPAHTAYVPGSLAYSTGDGAYDEENGTILWAGILPALISYRVDGYDWGDSDGRGTVPGVAPDWHDMTGAVDTGVSADDGVYGTFPIGFTFDFWDTRQDAFYVSPNGWIGFSDDGGSIVYCSDYGDVSTPNHFIGGFGGDRAVHDRDGGSITYKLFGAEPNRRLVVQFTNMRYHYSSSDNTLDMQIVLYEKGREILAQYRDLTTSPTTSYTGLEGPGPDYPYELYGDICPAEIREGLAILFRPRWAPTMGHSTDISYAVTVDESAPNNTWITNTATLASSFITVQRRAGTWINPVDLSASHKAAPPEVASGEALPYALYLQNTGLHAATGATISDPIPPHTAYMPGSLACSSGSCTYDTAGQAVRWSGDIAPNGTVTLSFAVTLTNLLPDRTPITNTATLEDGYGHTRTLQAVTIARTPDLSGSFKQASPETVDAGEAVTYTIYVRNSGVVDTTAEMYDALPAGLTYVPDSLSCGTGTCRYASGAVTWTGAVGGTSMVPIQFRAKVPTDGWPGQRIVNAATVVDRTTGQSHSTSATVRLPGASRQMLYLPFVTQDAR